MRVLPYFTRIRVIVSIKKCWLPCMKQKALFIKTYTRRILPGQFIFLLKWAAANEILELMFLFCRLGYNNIWTQIYNKNISTQPSHHKGLDFRWLLLLSIMFQNCFKLWICLSRQYTKIGLLFRVNSSVIFLKKYLTP